MLGRPTPPILPKKSLQTDLTQNFHVFFVEKVQQATTVASGYNNISNLSFVSLEPRLSQVTPTTHKAIVKVIRSTKNTSSELDPIPTHIIKKCMFAFIPLITVLANKILADGLPPLIKTQLIIG
jgi:hypothetical protein